MSTKRKLKCYLAGSKSDPDGNDYCAAAFAYTAKEAKMLMWNQSEWLSERCEGDLLDVRVKRVAHYDGYAVGEKPYIPDNSVLRQFGWRMEDDFISCDSCGLYEMESVPVCGDCNQCEECGCDCSETEL